MKSNRFDTPACGSTRVVLRSVLNFAALSFLLGASAGIARNLDRLRSLPSSRRETLADNLTRFQSLDPRDQELARRFERQLDEIEDPQERRRLLDLLNRFHSWVQRLPAEKRESLRKADSDERRLELVQQYHRETLADFRRFDAIWVNSGAFAPRSLFVIAHFIRCWNALDASQREQIDAIADNPGFLNRAYEYRNRFIRLNQAGGSKGIYFGNALMPLRELFDQSAMSKYGGKPVLPEFDSLLNDLRNMKTRRAEAQRLAANPPRAFADKNADPRRRRVEASAILEYFLKLADSAEKEREEAEWPSPLEQAKGLYWFAPNRFNQLIRPLEVHYFQEHANQLPVLPRELIDFEENTPPWILQPNVLDQLPATEARRRLTILYHLVHSPPGGTNAKPASDVKKSVAPKKSLK